MTPEAIAASLARYRPRSAVGAGEARAAAVLVPLLRGPRGVEVLFIVRPAHMPTHAGQVAFPGGRVDPTDRDRWHTAMREAHEELGIEAASVEPIGQLDELPTVSDYCVQPCVAWVSGPRRWRPEPGEVDEVFTMPLARFLDPQSRRTMRGRWRVRSQRMFFYLGERHVVWGATARMMANLVDALTSGGERA